MNNLIWKGKWTTKQYDPQLVHGDLTMELPVSFMNQPTKPLTCRVAIQYNGPYSFSERAGDAVRLYRRGDRSIIQMSTGPTGDYARAFQEYDFAGKQSLPVFKGFIQEQQINFKCNFMSEDKISGTYQTINPRDYGTFEVYPTRG